MNNKIEKFIKQYNNFNFTEDQIECEASASYKTFERKYKNILKEIAADAGMELYSFNKSYFEFCAVLKDILQEKFYYFSISDVRYWDDEWNQHILIRTMKHAKDWTGGSNSYTTLQDAAENLKRLKNYNN